MTGPISVVIYTGTSGSPFLTWITELKDRTAAAAVRARINRLRLGNFGDCKSVGSGVEELRIDFGPGYRVYFARDGKQLVVLLCGGAKRTQAKDIRLAQQYWKEYRDAKDEN